MPHRPPEVDTFSRDPQPSGVVIAQIGILDMGEPKVLQDFKPLSQQQSSFSRPNTAQGVVRAPRRMSFSRPLTSDGPHSGSAPTVPRLPLKTIQTQQLISDPAKIGVAVGSPTQWSAGGTPKRPREDSMPTQPPREHTARRLPMRANTDTAIAPHAPQWSSSGNSPPSKVKRWRSVGGLFKKKTKPTGAPEVSPPPPPPKVPEKDQKEPKAGRSRKSSNARKAPPRQPTIVEEPEPPQWPARNSSMNTPKLRSRAVKKNTESKSCLRASMRKPLPPPGRYGAGPWSDFQEQVRKRGSRPQLDVTIPEVEFERYSVMFGDLLKKPTESPITEPAQTTTRHEPIISLDTIASGDSLQPSQPASNRERSLNTVADLDLLPPVPKIDAASRSPGSISSVSGTPKVSSYSLFPTVKPSPNPSMTSLQPPLSARQPTFETPANAAPIVPNPTPDYGAVSVAVVPRDHIISQQAIPQSPNNAGLGLHTGFGAPSLRTHERHVPSPLGRIEPRELRSPDFSPDSPITRGTSISSTWSERPSIAHTRSKSSGAAVGSPGPSMSSNIDSYYATTEDENQPPIPVAAHPMKTPTGQISRSASLRSHPLHAPGGSPRIEYEGPLSPQVATARQVAVTGKPQKPHMLPRTSSKKKDHMALARLSEAPSRAASPQLVVVDNSDKPDEDTWLQRRSVWGVIEENGRGIS